MSDRYICTKSHPYKSEYGDRSVHPDAISVGSRDGRGLGDSSYDVFKCPHCGLTFKEEVAQ